MKIGIFVNKFPSVSETFVVDQVNGMLERGHDVQVFARKRGLPSVDHEDLDDRNLQDRVRYLEELPDSWLERVILGGAFVLKHIWKHPVTVCRLISPFRYGFSPVSNGPLAAVKRFLETDRPDVIHCHFGPQGILAAKLHDLGLINGYLVTFHGYDLHSYVQEQGREIYEQVFQTARKCITVSNYLKERLISLGCPEEKVMVIPGAVKLSRFKPAEYNKNNRDRISILTVARLTEVKGLSYGIDAVGILIEKGLPLHYRIVGEGPQKKFLSDKIKEMGLEDRIHLVGAKSRSRVVNLYGEADLFLLPGVTGSSGEQEGQGLVLLEAQAMKLPVVASNTGGIPESIEDGKTGYLVNEKNVRELADRIEELVHDSELRQRMGNAGRELVRNKFRIQDRINQLEAIYREVLEEAGEASE